MKSKRMGEQKEQWVLAKEQNSEQKRTKEMRTNKPGSLALQQQGAAEEVLSLVQGKPFPKNPTTKKYKWHQSCLTPFPGTSGVFWAQSISDSSDKLVSLMSLMFYIQFTIPFFSARALREETALLASSQPLFIL